PFRASPTTMSLPPSTRIADSTPRRRNADRMHRQRTRTPDVPLPRKRLTSGDRLKPLGLTHGLINSLSKPPTKKKLIENLQQKSAVLLRAYFLATPKSNSSGNA